MARKVTCTIHVIQITIRYHISSTIGYNTVQSMTRKWCHFFLQYTFLAFSFQLAFIISDYYNVRIYFNDYNFEQWTWNSRQTITQHIRQAHKRRYTEREKNKRFTGKIYWVSGYRVPHTVKRIELSDRTKYVKMQNTFSKVCSLAIHLNVFVIEMKKKILKESKSNEMTIKQNRWKRDQFNVLFAVFQCAF